MTSMDTPPENEQPDENPGVPLSRRERLAAAVAGILMLGAGTTAVFMRDVEAGPTALIGLGAFLLVIAISGVTVKSLRIGDNQVDMHRRREEAAVVLSETPADQLQAAVDILAAYDPAAVSDRSVRMALTLAYEAAALAALRSEFGSEFHERRVGPVLNVLHVNGIQCEVSIRRNSYGNPQFLTIFRNLLTRATREHVVLIAAQRPSLDLKLQAIEIFQEAGKSVHFVAWAASDGPASLRQAITEAVR
ncbi:hypothetical protein [Streptomyces harbinensis]